MSKVAAVGGTMVIFFCEGWWALRHATVLYLESMAFLCYNSMIFGKNISNKTKIN